MRTSELAKLVGYSGAHLRRLAIAGVVPGLRTTKGGHYWFKDSRRLRVWIGQRSGGVVLGSSIQTLKPVPREPAIEEMDTQQLKELLEALRPSVETADRVRRQLDQRGEASTDEQPGPWRVW